MAKTSRTEQIAQELMAHFHPELVPQYGYRPDWLKNPETGRNLEIDIWYGDLQAGLEIQGIHHGRPIDGLQGGFELIPQTFWQRLWGSKPKYRFIQGSSAAGFVKQQRHDMLKIERCREYGVRLYRLTIFDLTEREFLGWLRVFEDDNRLLPNGNRPLPTELFAEAERLSRRRFRPARQQDVLPTVWQRAWEWLKD